MIKLVALFRKPDDPEAFLRHYREVHDPLVRKTPGLARYEVSRVTGDPFGGEPAYFLVAEMYYPDRARSAPRCARRRTRRSGGT